PCSNMRLSDAFRRLPTTTLTFIRFSILPVVDAVCRGGSTLAFLGGSFRGVNLLGFEPRA
ncbi:hypothetical protein, partial [Bradyrhizobium sp.]|uniref:hypothetical protein n=1 Tax=Bradyrhizobium sp. TaxID=376 RepID=UPI003C1671DF